MTEVSQKKQKILFRAVFAIVAGLCVALPIIGTFAVSMSEWLAVLPLIPLFILSVILPKMLANGKAQKKVAIALPTVAVLISLISLLGVFCNPYFGSVTFRNRAQAEYTKTVTADEAAKDLKTVWKILNKRHPLFIDGAPDGFEDAYNAALLEIESCDSMTVNELRRVISEFLAPLHDAHTSISQRYSDDRYLVNDWGGMRFVSINGITREELRERAKSCSSYEVEEWISIDVGRLSTLDFYGIDFPITFELSDESGNIVTKTYTEDDYITYDKYLELISQNADSAVTEEPFVYYDIDAERSLAVLTLNSCIYSNEYKSILRNMFGEVKSNGIQHVAVDLRSNGGGNSLVANELIKYLPVNKYSEGTYKWRLGPFMLNFDNGEVNNHKYSDLTFSGDVYILTSSNTFSSAMLFAQYFSDNDLGTVIGEPPANAANSYGDITMYRLSNSGLIMSCSTKFFRRASGTDVLLVEPDVHCDSDDVFAELYEIIA